MTKLTLRLQTVADLIRPRALVIDVGADHGLLGHYLLERDLVSLIQLVENKTGPFNTLQNSMDVYRDDSRLVLTFADGLSQCLPQIDTVVISGMGGPNIIRVLQAAGERLLSIRQVILGPHTKSEMVKAWVLASGFLLEHEKIVTEGHKTYTIFSFIRKE